MTWIKPVAFPDFTGVKRIAIDTETRDEGLKAGLGSGWFNRNGEVLGMSIAFRDAENNIRRYYYPIAHIENNMDDVVGTVKFFREFFADYTGELVFHNAVYDIGWLKSLGILFNKEAVLVDTSYAAALLDENRFSYRLDDLAKEELGVGKDYTMLEEAMAERGIRTIKEMMQRLQELPAEYVGPYAEQDAEVTLRLWEHYSDLIALDKGLPQVMRLECRGIPMLIAMRERGVPLDMDRVHELIKDFKKREDELQNELNFLAGQPFPRTRTAAQVALIVKTVGEEYFKKSDKGNYLVGKKHIGNIKHPLLDTLKELNHVTKLRKDFLENFLKYEVNGRIHAEFHPLKTNREGSSDIISTKTGRFSSSSPNLTNIPADGELGKLIRSCFIPDEGCDWLCADYSQQEYRWAAHFAIKARVQGWQTVKKMYELNPKLDFHDMGSELLFGNTDHANRKKVKTLGFGILYGQGLAGFASALGCDMSEAKDLLEKYKEKVPFVTGVMQSAMRQAQSTGMIRTYYGRIRHYDFYELGGKKNKLNLGVVKGLAEAVRKTMTKNDPWYNQPIKRYKTYTAINSACQGSSADQTKAAAVYMFEKYGIVPYIIVHDEFDLPVPKGNKEIPKQVVSTMENIFKLEVPVRAEAGLGRNWSEAKD